MWNEKQSPSLNALLPWVLTDTTKNQYVRPEHHQLMPMMLARFKMKPGWRMLTD